MNWAAGAMFAVKSRKILLDGTLVNSSEADMDLDASLPLVAGSPVAPANEPPVVLLLQPKSTVSSDTTIRLEGKVAVSARRLRSRLTHVQALERTLIAEKAKLQSEKTAHRSLLRELEVQRRLESGINVTNQVLSMEGVRSIVQLPPNLREEGQAISNITISGGFNPQTTTTPTSGLPHLESRRLSHGQDELEEGEVADAEKAPSRHPNTQSKETPATGTTAVSTHPIGGDPELWQRANSPALHLQSSTHLNDSSTSRQDRESSYPPQASQSVSKSVSERDRRGTEERERNLKAAEARERLRREREERDRKEREDRDRREREEKDRREREERDRKVREDREKKEREERDRKEREERDRKEREERDRKEREERDRKEREEKDRKERQERERREREERDRKERDERIRKEREDRERKEREEREERDRRVREEMERLTKAREERDRRERAEKFEREKSERENTAKELAARFPVTIRPGGDKTPTSTRGSTSRGHDSNMDMGGNAAKKLRVDEIHPGLSDAAVMIPSGAVGSVSTRPGAVPAASPAHSAHSSHAPVLSNQTEILRKLLHQKQEQSSGKRKRDDDSSHASVQNLGPVSEFSISTSGPVNITGDGAMLIGKQSTPVSLKKTFDTLWRIKVHGGTAFVSQVPILANPPTTDDLEKLRERVRATQRLHQQQAPELQTSPMDTHSAIRGQLRIPDPAPAFDPSLDSTAHHGSPTPEAESSKECAPVETSSVGTSSSGSATATVAENSGPTPVPPVPSLPGVAASDTSEPFVSAQARTAVIKETAGSATLPTPLNKEAPPRTGKSSAGAKAAQSARSIKIWDGRLTTLDGSVVNKLAQEKKIPLIEIVEEPTSPADTKQNEVLKKLVQEVANLKKMAVIRFPATKTPNSTDALGKRHGLVLLVQQNRLFGTVFATQFLPPSADEPIMEPPSQPEQRPVEHGMTARVTPTTGSLRSMTGEEITPLPMLPTTDSGLVSVGTQVVPISMGGMVPTPGTFAGLQQWAVPQYASPISIYPGFHPGFPASMHGFAGFVASPPLNVPQQAGFSYGPVPTTMYQNPNPH
ncbi:hypothetical protein HDU93_005696 [Gonapodya sp. JEL0774]|nr:hypothetical protein HDU93_005696 [Gonapodya sp. JEL0774]